jgi:hypothetical protein
LTNESSPGFKWLEQKIGSKFSREEEDTEVDHRPPREKLRGNSGKLNFVIDKIENSDRESLADLETVNVFFLIKLGEKSGR